MKRKHRDWGSWWAGLRTSALASGAKAVSASLTTFVGTNGVASLNIPFLSDIGMNWKTALCQTGVQFFFHAFMAASRYIENKPDADIIVEEVETNFLNKPQTKETNEKTAD